MKDRISRSAVISCSLAAFVLLFTTSCSKLDDIQQQAGKTRDEVNKTQSCSSPRHSEQDRGAQLAAAADGEALGADFFWRALRRLR
jgi:hypothetical protein